MKLSPRLTLVLAAILFSAPGFGKSLKVPPAPIFFPLPPDEPRIQYLTSFSSERDLGGSSKFFNFIVGTQPAARAIDKPYGIAATAGKYYICDTGGDGIAIADLKKRKVNFFQPNGDAAIGLPINIAVEPDGTRYITDTQRQMVLIYNGDNYAGAIGKLNEMKPCGIAIFKNRVYVSDLQNHCMRVYDKASHNLLFTFPKAGSDKKAALYAPTNVAIDQQGRVYVSDTGGFCVNVYDAEGNFLRTFGGIGLRPGQFARPKGIAVDRQGLTYVVDASTDLVQLFDEQGRILMYFGDAARGVTGLPAGIAVDYDNVAQFQKYVAPNFTVEYLILVANQTGGNKVSVFGFGHKK